MEELRKKIKAKENVRHWREGGGDMISHFFFFFFGVFGNAEKKRKRRQVMTLGLCFTHLHLYQDSHVSFLFYDLFFNLIHNFII